LADFAQYRVIPILMLLGSGASMTPQSTSGSITGAVSDSSGLAVEGAEVTLDSETSGATWKATTGFNGTFVFSSIPPGEFALEIVSSGFTPYKQTDVTLNALERLSIGMVTLQVGSGATQVLTVNAAADAVQTTSSERSAVLDSNQLQYLSARGRDYMHLLEVLPGVSSNGP
jgi:hypothetical protein